MSRRRDHESFICGFIPLTDCATLVAAHEFGFAAEEGVALDLRRETSWSNIRDKTAVELFDIAHMLAPMPIAMSLGLSSFPAEVVAPFVLSVNGNVVGVSTALARRIRTDGVAFGHDPAAAAAGLASAMDGAPLRVGSPWSFSMHSLLVEYWLERSGVEFGAPVHQSIVPPRYMADALAAGEIDIFAVGEPWGSIAVETGAGALLLPGSAIWSFAPEKVLGVRGDVLATRPDAVDALLRALYRAARWASKSDHFSAVAEVLSRAEYLDAPAEIIERALTGMLIVAPSGEARQCPRVLELFDGAATFPWRSQAEWLGAALARRPGGSAIDLSAVAKVFRPDVYRRALQPIGAVLPTASAKLEGALQERTPASALNGPLALGPDAFFDGAVFEPLPIE